MRTRIGVAVLAATIPLAALVVDPGGWYPFGPSKWLVVSALIPIGAAFVLWDRPVRSSGRASLLAGLLVGWMAIAAVVGADRLYAWVGTPERHLGVLTWALAAIALVAGQALDPDRDRAPLTWAITIAGFGVGAFACAEALGWEPSLFQVTPGRLTATAGSAAYLGAWTALLLPALVGIAADDQVDRRLRTLAAVGTGALAVACIGSGARAAWVGLAVAGIVVLVVHRATLAAHRRRALLGLAGGAVVLAAVIVLSPAGGRLSSATNADAAGGRSRLDEWRVAAHVLVHHPLTGVGPEGYRIAFPEGVDDRYQQAYGRDPLPDRAHSGPLDVAVTGGLPALALWLALVTLVGRAALRALRGERRWLAGIGAAVIAHFVEQLLLFPTAEIEPVVWLLAGLLLTATTATVDRRERTWARPLVALVGSVGILALVAGSLDLAADRLAERSTAAGRSGDHDTAVRLARDAVALRPDEVRLHLLEAQALIADDRGTRAALDAVAAALDVSPRDPIVLRQQADLLVQRASATHLPADVDAARAQVEHLLDGDRANTALWLLAGAAARLGGDAPGAEAAFTRAEVLAPHDAEPSIELALLYLDAGRLDDARGAAERAVARHPDDPRAQQVLDHVRDAAATRSAGG